MEIDDVKRSIITAIFQHRIDRSGEDQTMREFSGQSCLLSCPEKSVWQVSRPLGWVRLSWRVGLYRSSDKTHFLLNRLLTFLLCVFGFRFFECFVRTGKFVVGFFLIKASEASHFFVFRLFGSLFRLSTTLYVKDLIKLKTRARALRFFISLKYKRKKGVSVSDNTNVAVSDNTNIWCFSVSDNTCPSTGILLHLVSDNTNVKVSDNTYLPGTYVRPIRNQNISIWPISVSDNTCLFKL